MTIPRQIRTWTQRQSHTDLWMGWRKFMRLIGGLAIAWPLAPYAQQPKQPLKRVGILAVSSPCPLHPNDLIVRRLGELGWIEGKPSSSIAYRQSAALIKFRRSPTNWSRGAPMY